MGKILIFAGTTEGRLLWEECDKRSIPVTASVATDYGETMLTLSKFSDIVTGRLTCEEMKSFIAEGGYTLVLDATHPYASFVTENLKKACKETKAKYVRIIRETVETLDGIFVDSVPEAAEYLNQHPGNALIATGSKELKEYTKVADYTNRLTARVLPDAEVIRQCVSLGFQGKHLIGMQGPFSAEMNYLMLKETSSDYLVTKEAGTYGGFSEKLEGAKKAGAKLLIIRRPGTETGVTLFEAMELIQEHHSQSPKSSVK
jgi:precorrin-6x reductase